MQETNRFKKIIIISSMVFMAFFISLVPVSASEGLSDDYPYDITVCQIDETDCKSISTFKELKLRIRVTDNGKYIVEADNMDAHHPLSGKFLNRLDNIIYGSDTILFTYYSNGFIVKDANYTVKDEQNNVLFHAPLPPAQPDVNLKGEGEKLNQMILMVVGLTICLVVLVVFLKKLVRVLRASLTF